MPEYSGYHYIEITDHERNIGAIELNKERAIALLREIAKYLEAELEEERGN
jgi:hypothetical protein